jgi:hypothetical protein
MRELEQSVTAKFSVKMVDAADHVSDKTGLTLTVLASKNGGAFATATASVAEVSNGWYRVEVFPTHVDTVGEAIFRCTATSADAGERIFTVVGTTRQDVYDRIGAPTGASIAADVEAVASDVWSFATRGLSASGVTEIWDKDTASLTAVGSVGKLLADNVDATISSRADASAYTSARAANLDNLDAAISTVSTHDATAVWSVATRALTDKAGFSLAADQSSVTIGTLNTNNDKTGYALSAAGVDAILDDTVEGAYTFRHILRLTASALCGESSGGGTTTVSFKGLDGSTNRIVATVDANGKRSAIILDGT